MSSRSPRLQPILEECWQPSLRNAHCVPKQTALKRDLTSYLNSYNHDRAHTGRLTQGRIPADIVYGANKVKPR